jgi:hypothetical protein
MLSMTEKEKHHGPGDYQPDGIDGFSRSCRNVEPILHTRDGLPDRGDPGLPLPDALDAGDTGDFEGDFWDAVDSGLFGGIPEGLSMDDQDGEDDMGRALDSGAEPVFLPQGYSPDIGGSKEKVTRGLREYVDELTAEKRLVFRLLQNRIITATAKRTRPSHREEALRWIFSAERSNTIGFEDTCIALESRPWVVRLRVQLQFWFKDIRFAAPIPLSAMPLPSRLAEEAYGTAWDDGIWVARRIWEWPGVHFDELCQITGAPPVRQIREALDQLEENGIVVSGFDGLYWYCVGHSPLNRHGRPLAVSWASFWHV